MNKEDVYLCIYEILGVLKQEPFFFEFMIRVLYFEILSKCLNKLKGKS